LFRRCQSRIPRPRDRICWRPRRGPDGVGIIIVAIAGTGAILLIIICNSIIVIVITAVKFTFDDNGHAACDLGIDNGL